MPLTTITTLPPAPQRTDTPATFAEKADVFVSALSTLQSELNLLGGDLNGFVDGAALVDFANYAGVWAAGTYSKGQSVWHTATGQFYISDANSNSATPPAGDWRKISAADTVSFDATTSGLTGATTVKTAIEAIVPTGGKVAKARLPAGSILQVVQGTTSTQVDVTTTTFTDTGLTATITPSSTGSKILVIVDQQFEISRNTTITRGGVRLLRGATVIAAPFEDSSGPHELGLWVLGASGVTSIGLDSRVALTILDSPSTTSATTYKTQGRPRSGGTEYMAFQSSYGGPVNATSRIILMEVAG
jgi:hypothetical protein